MSFYSLARVQMKLPTGTAAIVNEVSISDMAVDEAVKTNVARGQQEML